MDEVIETVPIGVIKTTAGGEILAINGVGADLLSGSRSEFKGKSIRTVIPRSVDDKVSTAFESGISTRRTIEEYYPELEKWVTVTLAPRGEVVIVYLQDRSRRRESERRIDSLQEELDRLAVTNEVISEALAELVGASSRISIAERICHSLGESELYDFAWFGEREVGGDGLVVQTAAGSTGRLLDQIEDCLNEGKTCPESRAIETASPEVVPRLAADEAIPEPIRRAAFADGVQSLLTIPLTHGEHVYGVIGVYASGLETLSERERASFGTVGEIAGFAVNATRNQNLLSSNSVVELDFRITDRTDPLVGTTAKLDAQLLLAGTVPKDDARLLCYLDVKSVSPEQVIGIFRNTFGIEECRVVRSSEHSLGGMIEGVFGTETAIGMLASSGITVQSATFEEGTGRIVLELSPEEDVRRIADAFTREFNGEFLAKREVERSATTAQEFRDELGDRLTDKQQRALRAALLAEYFETPHGSTAEEVGKALDISGSTLLYHLRAGQKKLLEEFFAHTDG